MVTKSPEATVQVKRYFDASPEQVFDAWLDPEKARYFLFATPAGKMLKVEIDARVGGKYRIVEKRGDMEAEHTGRYLGIERPRHLAFTFAVPGFPETHVTLDIVPSGNGCELTLTHTGVLAEYKDRTQSGWGMILDSLHTTFTQPAAKRSHI